MKLVYLGDNSDRINWGCRATSIALRHLLERAHAIHGTIFGTLIETPVALYQTGKANSNRKWLGLPFRNRLTTNDCKTHGDQDFVDCDINASADRLMNSACGHELLERALTHINESDAVVINGEGDMIFRTPARRKLLFLLTIMEVGFRLNKPVFFINSMVSDCPTSEPNEVVRQACIRALERCTTVTVRDCTSLRTLQEIGCNAPVSVIPDALFTWAERLQSEPELLPVRADAIIPFPERHELFGKFDFCRPYCCVGGTSLYSYVDAQARAAIVNCYIHLVEALQRCCDLTVYLTKNCIGDDFLDEVSVRTGVAAIPAGITIFSAAAILSHARVFISGRYHPSIMASLGGTPCVFLASNSHKTRSLQDMLDYDSAHEYALPLENRDISEIVARVQSIIREGDARRTQIRQTALQRGRESLGLLTCLANSVASGGG